MYRLVYGTMAEALKHQLLLLGFPTGPLIPIQCSTSNETAFTVQLTLPHMVVDTKISYHNNLETLLHQI